MASDDTAPDLHERVHSHVWWKVKTGWTDAQYVGRKNALLTKSREEWPDKEEDLKQTQFADGIESLVATFDDRAWCLKAEEDQTSRFEEQLRLYSKWAAAIHAERSNIPEDRLYDTPTTTSARAHKVSLITDQSFNWWDVKMCLDYRIRSKRLFNLPMTEVATKSTPYWQTFSFDTFHEYLRKTAHYPYSAHGLLVFWIRGKDYTPIDSDGDYKIMLKSFSKTYASTSTLTLLITDSVRNRLFTDEYGSFQPSLLARAG